MDSQARSISPTGGMGMGPFPPTGGGGRSGGSGTGAGSPVSVTPTAASTSPNGRGGEGPAGPGSAGNGAKRKSEDGQQHTRAKRNRYISIACNECKRRKIKCNGETPCQRCGNLNLQCLYAPNCCGGSLKDSEDFRQMRDRVAALEEQVGHLSQCVAGFRSHPSPMPLSAGSEDPNAAFNMSSSAHQSPAIPPSPSKQRPRRPQVRHPRFKGPTSSAFSFDVAKSSLQTMGITNGDELSNDIPATQEDVRQLPSPGSSTENIGVANPSKDPLWMIGLKEAVRLTKVYEEEMGTMYPILDIEKVITHAKNLYRYLSAATKTGLPQLSQQGSDVIDDDDTNVLKLVLANALMVEGSGQSEHATRLFESVKKAADRVIWGGELDLKGLSILVLTSMFFFHQDEEPLAWRLIGITARMCVELGLHRRETLIKGFESDEEQRWAMRLFWSVYCLDRRWSMGTGMPFALQEAEIDPMLPEPDSSTAYLLTMIEYGRISSKVWKSVVSVDHPGNEEKLEQIQHLDLMTCQWHNSIPDSLKYLNPATGQEVKSETRGIRRLRILLYLRFNQMRMLIYRPILESATSIMENHNAAVKAVDIAKDTIKILSRLNQTSDIYQTQQICFNYFLVSALGVLFLAVAHAPAKFSNMCRDEFYLALDLVKGFSNKSYISKRLWRTIRGLKEYGPKLGLRMRNGQQVGIGIDDPNDAHSSAAVAMAGLAGHNVDDFANAYRNRRGGGLENNRPGDISILNGPPNRDLVVSPMNKSPLNGSQMSHELTSLFEAANSYANNAGPDPLATGSDQPYRPSSAAESNSGAPPGALYPTSRSAGGTPHGMNGFVTAAGPAGPPPPPGPPGPPGPTSFVDGSLPPLYGGNEEEFSRIMQGLY